MSLYGVALFDGLGMVTYIDQLRRDGGVLSAVVLDNLEPSGRYQGDVLRRVCLLQEQPHCCRVMRRDMMLQDAPRPTGTPAARRRGTCRRSSNGSAWVAKYGAFLRIP